MITSSLEGKLREIWYACFMEYREKKSFHQKRQNMREKFGGFFRFFFSQSFITV